MNDPKETTRDFLARRQHELIEEIGALHHQLLPKEAELAELRRAMGALGMPTGPLPPTGLLHPTGPNGPEPSAWAWRNNSLDAASQVVADHHRRNSAHLIAGIQGFAQTPVVAPQSSYQNMTMKQLVMKALQEHFREGATSKQLREFFRDGYGRAIERNNLAPQITRLRQDGLIESIEGGKWRLMRNRLTLTPERLLENDEPPSSDTQEDE